MSTIEFIKKQWGKEKAASGKAIRRLRVFILALLVIATVGSLLSGQWVEGILMALFAWYIYGLISKPKYINPTKDL